MSYELDDRLTWWREARFGMFIHWGVYAVPAGFWKGQPIPSLGEWIMRNAKIPLEEYAALAKQFNPVKFDAREWVAIAKAAGMKYLVITSKHHDGFGMFKSADPYNIVDATPYGHDVMADLAEACQEARIRLCFYYSQDQDWAAPGASGHWEEALTGNWWNDKPAPEKFAQYLEAKVKPQLTELLTNYGPIGLIWFDTPVAITREQSEMLRDFVHALQPDCLVSGRVGHDVGDYGSLGDNQIPCGPVEGAWETPATLNDTWGFKSDDHNWKSVEDLLYLLVDLASKGVNYLLNVGPTAEGLIPQPSIDSLLAIGKWMDVNSEAIYGTDPNPYPYELDWGRITTKGDKLYLLLYGWPEKLQLVGLRNNVRRAYLLADPVTDIPLTQAHDPAADQHSLCLELPASRPDPIVSVVVLEVDQALDVDQAPLQQPGGGISLPAYLATMHRSCAESTLTLSRSKVIQDWKDTAEFLSWQLKVSTPGDFTVRVVLSSPHHGQPSAAGHIVTLSVGDQALSGELTNEEKVDSPRAQYFPEFASILGQVRFNAAGSYELRLGAEAINPAGQGLTVSAVELTPL